MKTALSLLLFAAIAEVEARSQAPSVPAATGTANVSLTIEVGGAKPLMLTVADLSKFPRTSVKTSEDGIEISYGGVLLSELLRIAGAPVGAALQGKDLATCLVAEARDGYRVVYALAEFDPDFNDNPVIVADTRDGRPLRDHQGPFRLVAPKEKRGARSIRMLTRLRLVRLPD